MTTGNSARQQPADGESPSRAAASSREETDNASSSSAAEGAAPGGEQQAGGSAASGSTDTIQYSPSFLLSCFREFEPLGDFAGHPRIHCKTGRRPQQFERDVLKPSEPVASPHSKFLVRGQRGQPDTTDAGAGRGRPPPWGTGRGEPPAAGAVAGRGRGFEIAGGGAGRGRGASVAAGTAAPAAGGGATTPPGGSAASSSTWDSWAGSGAAAAGLPAKGATATSSTTTPEWSSMAPQQQRAALDFDWRSGVGAHQLQQSAAASAADSASPEAGGGVTTSSMSPRSSASGPPTTTSAQGAPWAGAAQQGTTAGAATAAANDAADRSNWWRAAGHDAGGSGPSSSNEPSSTFFRAGQQSISRLPATTAAAAGASGLSAPGQGSVDGGQQAANRTNWTTEGGKGVLGGYNGSPQVLKRLGQREPGCAEDDWEALRNPGRLAAPNDESAPSAEKTAAAKDAVSHMAPAGKVKHHRSSPHEATAAEPLLSAVTANEGETNQQPARAEGEANAGELGRADSDDTGFWDDAPIAKKLPPPRRPAAESDKHVAAPLPDQQKAPLPPQQNVDVDLSSFASSGGASQFPVAGTPPLPSALPQPMTAAAGAGPGDAAGSLQNLTAQAGGGSLTEILKRVLAVEAEQAGHGNIADAQATSIAAAALAAIAQLRDISAKQVQEKPPTSSTVTPPVSSPPAVRDDDSMSSHLQQQQQQQRDSIASQPIQMLSAAHAAATSPAVPAFCSDDLTAAAGALSGLSSFRAPVIPQQHPLPSTVGSGGELMGGADGGNLQMFMDPVSARLQQQSLPQRAPIDAGGASGAPIAPWPHTALQKESAAGWHPQIGATGGERGSHGSSSADLLPPMAFVSTLTLNDAVWEYRDYQNKVQGPFSARKMLLWWQGNYFPKSLQMRYSHTMPWVAFELLFPVETLKNDVMPFTGFPRVTPSGRPGAIFFPPASGQTSLSSAAPQPTDPPTTSASASTTSVPTTAEQQFQFQNLIQRAQQQDSRRPLSARPLTDSLQQHPPVAPVGAAGALPSVAPPAVPASLGFPFGDSQASAAGVLPFSAVRHMAPPQDQTASAQQQPPVAAPTAPATSVDLHHAAAVTFGSAPFSLGGTSTAADMATTFDRLPLTGGTADPPPLPFEDQPLLSGRQGVSLGSDSGGAVGSPDFSVSAGIRQSGGSQMTHGSPPTVGPPAARAADLLAAQNYMGSVAGQSRAAPLRSDLDARIEKLAAAAAAARGGSVGSLGASGLFPFPAGQAGELLRQQRHHQQQQLSPLLQGEAGGHVMRPSSSQQQPAHLPRNLDLQALAAVASQVSPDVLQSLIENATGARQPQQTTPATTLGNTAGEVDSRVGAPLLDDPAIAAGDHQKEATDDAEEWTEVNNSLSRAAKMAKMTNDLKMMLGMVGPSDAPSHRSRRGSDANQPHQQPAQPAAVPPTLPTPWDGTSSGTSAPAIPVGTVRTPPAAPAAAPKATPPAPRGVVVPAPQAPPKAKATAVEPPASGPAVAAVLKKGPGGWGGQTGGSAGGPSDSAGSLLDIMRQEEEQQRKQKQAAAAVVTAAESTTASASSAPKEPAKPLTAATRLAAALSQQAGTPPAGGRGVGRGVARPQAAAESTAAAAARGTTPTSKATTASGPANAVTTPSKAAAPASTVSSAGSKKPITFLSFLGSKQPAAKTTQSAWNIPESGGRGARTSSGELSEGANAEGEDFETSAEQETTQYSAPVEPEGLFDDDFAIITANAEAKAAGQPARTTTPKQQQDSPAVKAAAPKSAAAAVAAAGRAKSKAAAPEIVPKTAAGRGWNVSAGKLAASSTADETGGSKAFPSLSWAVGEGKKGAAKETEDIPPLVTVPRLKKDVEQKLDILMQDYKIQLDRGLIYEMAKNFRTVPDVANHIATNMPHVAGRKDLQYFALEFVDIACEPPAHPQPKATASPEKEKSQDAAQVAPKKKRGKKTVVDPALLGFSVRNNRPNATTG